VRAKETERDIGCVSVCGGGGGPGDVHRQTETEIDDTYIHASFAHTRVRTCANTHVCIYTHIYSCTRAALPPLQHT